MGRGPKGPEPDLVSFTRDSTFPTPGRDRETLSSSRLHQSCSRHVPKDLPLVVEPNVGFV